MVKPAFDNSEDGIKPAAGANSKSANLAESDDDVPKAAAKVVSGISEAAATLLEPVAASTDAFGREAF